LPILDQKALDAVLAKYGGGSLSAGEYRDNYNTFGWNVKSDGSSVKQGAAIWGVEKQTNPMGGYVWYTGDMKAVANQLGVDISGLKTQDQIFNAINDKVSDFYLVSNALDRTGVAADKQTPHASILFKSDGSGNLLPVTDETGNVVQSNYNSIVVHHGGASEQFAELAPLLSMAAMVFAPQMGAYLNSAIGGIQVSAAVAPTAFTMGLPAVTLAQTIGATGVSMLSGAIQNMVTSGLTGGDKGKAALTGAVGPAISGNANQMLNRVGIDQSKIEAIASATNTSAQQVTNMLSNALTVGVTGVVLGNPNALEDAATGLAGQFVGTQAQNLVYDAMKGADPKIIATTVNAAGNVSNIATQTLINGGDVTAALQNAMPSIITGAARAGEAVGKTDTGTAPGTATIEERSTYPDPTLDPSDITKPDSTLGKKPDSDYYDEFAEAFDKPLSEGVGKQIGPAYAGQIESLPPVVVTAPIDDGKSLEHGVTIANRDDPDDVEDYIKDTIFNIVSPNFNSLINFSKINDPNAASSSSAVFNPFTWFGAPPVGSVGNAAKRDSIWEFLGETSSGKPVFKTKDANGGDGPLFTLFILEGQPPKLVNAEGTVTVIPLDVAEKLQDQSVKVKDVLKANKSDAPVFEDNTLKVVKEPPKVDVKLSDIVDPNKKPEVKPTDVKPETTTTAGGSSTAAPTPAPTPTPQQQVVELQKQADAAQVEVLNTANNFIQNPTPENKAKADSAKLNYELVAKVAEAAKAGVPLTQAPQPAPTSGSSGSNAADQPSGAPQGSEQPSQPGSQQTGAQQPSQLGSQQPEQPGVPLPAQPGSDQPSQTASTTPGSGTSNLPGDSTSTTAGLGGNGTGGTGTGGTGTSGTGTSGTGTGAGTGVGVGTDIMGALSALAGAFGSGKVSTGAGGLSQVPAGYTAVTTPLAKRPIGDLYPVSFTMMTPEEIAARSSTKIARRGGLISTR
jgi:hypothetical protein